MNTIGSKIKTLRKELNLTQTELAGSEMTKSMLSQIENGIATPSMKNLAYLASTLGKPVSFFLDDYIDEAVPELPIEEINSLVDEVNILRDNEKYTLAKEKLEALFNKYDLKKHPKLYADVLMTYIDALIELSEFDKVDDMLDRCLNTYLNLSSYVDAAKAYQNKGFRPFANFDYEGGLKILEEAYSIYKKAVHRDVIFEMENLYFRAATYFSLGRVEETIDNINKALEISKRSGAYYKTDEFYRIKSLCYYYQGKLDEFKYYIEKAKQFAELTESKWPRVSIELNLASYENTYGDPEKALEHMKLYHELSERETVSNWYKHQVAISYYKLSRYEEAYALISQYNYSVNRFSKLDYLLTWTTKIYEGLILNKLNRNQEAIASIETAIEKLIVHGNSQYLAFAYQSLGEVHAGMENFKEAYAFERKSIEVKEQMGNKGTLMVY